MGELNDDFRLRPDEWYRLSMFLGHEFEGLPNFGLERPKVDAPHELASKLGIFGVGNFSLQLTYEGISLENMAKESRGLPIIYLPGPPNQSEVAGLCSDSSGIAQRTGKYAELAVYLDPLDESDTFGEFFEDISIEGKDTSGKGSRAKGGLMRRN